jgi:hypothetical protein
MSTFIKHLLLFVCTAVSAIAAAQTSERALPLPEQFGLRESGICRETVMVQMEGKNLDARLDPFAIEKSCRVLVQMKRTDRLPTIDADVNKPDTVSVTRFMTPQGSAVADYSTHKAVACTNPETPFDPCHCRYGFVTTRYIRVKLRVADRLQTWRTQVGESKVVRNAGTARTRGPLLLLQRLEAEQIGPLVGTGVVAGLRCEVRGLREGYACVYGAGEDIPQVLRNTPASIGRDRDLASHHFRITDVAVRRLVDGAVFEPPAGESPVSSSASRPTR